jgi:hypothetical protein
MGGDRRWDRNGDERREMERRGDQGDLSVFPGAR